MWIPLVVAGGLLLLCGAVLYVRAVGVQFVQRATTRTPGWRSLVAGPSVAVLGLALIVAGVAARGSEGSARRPSTGAPDAATSTAASASGGPAAPTPSARLTEANKYRTAIVSVNNDVGAEMDALTDQLVAAKHDSPEWVSKTERVLGDMEATAARARGIEAPAEYRAAHAVWMDGVDAYDWVAKNMALAIDGPNADLMKQCIDRLGEASSYFKKATALMNGIDPR